MMNRDEQDNLNSLDDTAFRREIIDADVTDVDNETAEIRANIEHTRAEMSETIDAIQERLNPTHLKEQAKEQVREQFEEAKEMVREATIGRVEHMVQNATDTVNDARYTMMDTIRENPIPAALVGLGLGWLFMNRSTRTPVRYSGRGSVRGGQRYYNDQSRYYNDQSRYYNDQSGYYGDQRGYNSPGMMAQGRQAVGNTFDRAQNTAGNVVSSVGDTASSVVSTVGDTASSVASTVGDTASSVASTVSDTASNLVDQAQYGAQRVEDRFQQTLRTNPLAVGAVALALGTAVGLALPQTERENEWMGEARDTLLDRAQDVAQDTMEKVQRVASEVTSETSQTVREQAREHGLTS